MNLTLSSQMTNANDKLTDALAFLQFALSCLQETMSASSVAFPIVPILSVANAVVRTVQVVRSNEDRVERLLERLLAFIEHMSRISGYSGLENEDFNEELKNMLCTLQKTYDEILQLQKHTRTRKFLRHKSISGILDRCLDTIDYAWRTFDATVLFRIQQRLIDEDKRLKTILQTLEQRDSELRSILQKLEAQEVVSGELLNRIDGVREQLEHQTEFFVRSQNQALENISTTQEPMLNMLQAERQEHADGRFLTMQPAFMATCTVIWRRIQILTPATQQARAPI
ncbi:uncharacterized protein LAESUDRAFT_177654 [Laetiporus sulphureus 93-53]|uniref:Uncharacterized protein n=1 Tax=Laetiporus sulphureus 93-53 TaxID=1314785 RepID=A0A165E860_9APHY|nr:uncharacterized protein LAESUDRAFT_177654 [Laetiporus sulphureus 93-53]KZT06432.1 hypothetical protein LAESUDRAFT_177654 [Laetiporus sulphureus 93-53]